MKVLPWYKKCLGYLFPIIVTHRETDYHPKLKIKYYQGQWQLESAEALYSDGYRYTPFRLAFDCLDKKNELLPIQDFLLLGAGLGSALLRLQKIYNTFPDATLVEYDNEIIKLSKEYTNINQKKNVECVNEDVQDFLKSNQKTFDLIGVDIFDELANSELLKKEIFWLAVKKASTPNTNIIVNSIFTKKEELNEFEVLLNRYFEIHRIDRQPNYIYIIKLKK